MQINPSQEKKTDMLGDVNILENTKTQSQIDTKIIDQEKLVDEPTPPKKRQTNDIVGVL